MIEYNTPIDELNKLGLLSVRATNVCKTANIITLGELLVVDKQNLSMLKKCGRKTLNELEALKDRYAILSTIPISEQQIPNKENDLNKALEQYSLLPFSIQDKFSQWLDWRYSQLSTRTKNIFPEIGKVEVAVREMYLFSCSDILQIKNCGRKTSIEIEEYYNNIKETFQDLIANIDPSIEAQNNNVVERKVVELSREYPFLLAKECESIVEFEQQNGSFPYLFIIKAYILRAEDIYVRFCRDYYGINTVNMRHSLADIAAAHNLSNERVRQIVSSNVPLPKKLQIYVNQQLIKKIDAVVAFDDPLWGVLQHENMLEESFCQTARLVCSLLGSHMIIQINKDEKEYLVKKSLLENVNFMSAIRNLCRVLDLRRTKLQRLDILDFLSLKKCTYDGSVISLCSICSNYIKHKYNVEIENDRFVIAQPNTLDVSYAIENILEQRGEPMSLKELYETFNNLYPTSTIDSLSKIKPYIYKNPHIRAKGRTGIYMLDSWENHFTGTIIDYLEYLLRTFNEPISLNDLVDLVLEEFPKTNKKSIYSLIISDKNNRFVVYEGEYIGLLNGFAKNSELKERKFVKRFSFNTRFAAFKEFVYAHKRLPIQIGTEEEQSLARWMVNVLRANIDVSGEQMDALQEFLRENKSLPQNGLEYRFSQMCDRIKVYVNQNFTLPTFENNSSEYLWLRKNRNKYKEYTDNRKEYFENLLLYLKDFGFYL